MPLSEIGNCLEGGGNSGPEGVPVLPEEVAALESRVEVLSVETAQTRLVKGAQDGGGPAQSDNTRASEMEQTGAVSNGWGPGREQRRVANTRASSNGSGLEEGSSRWVGWENGLGQGISTGWQGLGRLRRCRPGLATVTPDWAGR